jgi:hypothetical protein
MFPQQEFQRGRVAVRVARGGVFSEREVCCLREGGNSIVPLRRYPAENLSDHPMDAIVIELRK